MGMEHSRSDFQPDAETKAKLVRVQEILNELHDAGKVVGYAWIAGLSSPEEKTDHLTYNACCAAHAVDFLCPDICLQSPVEEIRVQAREEFRKSVELLSNSPYALFREPFYPPSSN